MLSLRANEPAHELLKTLAKTFGGMFQEGDHEEIFESFTKPGEGNIDFIVKQAVKDNPKIGDDDKAMIDYITQEKWRDNATWHKGSKK